MYRPGGAWPDRVGRRGEEGMRLAAHPNEFLPPFVPSPETMGLPLGALRCLDSERPCLPSPLLFQVQPLPRPSARPPQRAPRPSLAPPPRLLPPRSAERPSPRTRWVPSTSWGPTCLRPRPQCPAPGGPQPPIYTCPPSSSVSPERCGGSSGRPPSRACWSRGRALREREVSAQGLVICRAVGQGKRGRYSLSRSGLACSSAALGPGYPCLSTGPGSHLLQALWGAP